MHDRLKAKMLVRRAHRNSYVVDVDRRVDGAGRESSGVMVLDIGQVMLAPALIRSRVGRIIISFKYVYILTQFHILLSQLTTTNQTLSNRST